MALTTNIGQIERAARRLTFLSSSVLLTLVGCRVPKNQTSQTANPAPEEIKIDNESESTDAEVDRAASAVSELRSTASFYFRVWNEQYEVNYSKIPPTGSVETDKTPFSGFWYPESRGGTNVGSALTKYDRAFRPGKTDATDWEKKNHTRPTTDKDAGWSGHCNGWAASAQRHAEPKNAVTKNGVRFEPNDIKALLAEVYMNAKSVFLGGTRCGTDASPCLETNPDTRPDPTKLDNYQDVNPGAFHVLLGNWIGKKKHTVVFDEKNDREVWNYPVHGYSFRSTPIRTAAEAVALVARDDGRGYRFNPEATKFLLIDTTITYANALGGEAAAGVFPNRTPATISYQYVLELNASDEILGGEWTKTSQKNHPDFMWVALESDLNVSGDKRFGNPNIDAKEVIRIWAESIGADPNNPPSDIVEPSWQSNWGKFPEFSVKLDGESSGAVFLGKPVKIEIQRSGKLAGKVTLELGHNDKVFKTLTLDAGATASAELPAAMGLNRLALVWKIDGGTPYSEFVRYFAMP
jgi:hypothetical protein